MTITFNNIKIFAFADTHGKHRQLEIPKNANMLVCAGDVCNGGNGGQLDDFYAWFAAQPAKYKLFVPGNHDLPFDLNPKLAALYIPQSVTYVESGGFRLGGIHFHVLPVRPWMHSQEAPQFFPRNVDVLVTHGAPLGILDTNAHLGCKILRNIVDKTQPKIHIFGHCHENGNQKTTIGNTTFYNVAIAEK